jgi:hypothetical protein
MSPINILYGGLNFTHASSFSAGVVQFAADRSVFGAWITEHWDEFVEWLEKPCLFFSDLWRFDRPLFGRARVADAK